jgi:hypothetical protein
VGVNDGLMQYDAIFLDFSTYFISSIHMYLLKANFIKYTSDRQSEVASTSGLLSFQV